MKKLIIIIFLALVSGISAQTVSPGFGSIITAEQQLRVINDGGDFYPNCTPPILDELKRDGIYGSMSMIMVPNSAKAGTLYSTSSSSSLGDFDWTRNDVSTVTNYLGNLEEIPINYPYIDYTSGCPVVYTHDATEQLLTYPISFGNSYWTKSGATIEGDASNIIGSEKVTNGTFEAGISTPPASWTNDGNQVGSSVADGTAPVGSNVMELVASGTGDAGANRVRATVSAFVDGQIYLVSFWAKTISGNTTLSSWTTTTELNSVTVDGTWTKHEFQYAYQGSGGLIMFFLDGAGTCRIDEVTIKELGYFSSPHTTLDDVAYKLVEDGTTAKHSIVTASSLTVLATTTYTQSYYIKTDEVTKIAFRESASTGKWASVNLATQEVLSSVNTSVTFQSIANGWVRVSFTLMSGSTSWHSELYLLDDSYTTSDPHSYTYAGTVGNGVYIFLSNLTKEPYASPPIVNIVGGVAIEGNTVTRVADLVKGATYSGDSESGVFYAQMAAWINQGSDATDIRSIYLTDGTDNNRVCIRFTGSADAANSVNFLIQSDGSAFQLQTITMPFDITNFHKYAIRWEEDNVTFWADGAQVGTTITSFVTFTTSALNDISLKRSNNTEYFYGKLKELGTLNYMDSTKMVQLTTQ